MMVMGMLLDFFGMHILYELLENEFGIIYCLIGPKKCMSIEDRFRKLFYYYFNCLYFIKKIRRGVKIYK